MTDRPGVLAEITAAMRDAGVSIESLIQQGRPEEGGEVLVAMVTHEGPESAVARALALLEGSPSLTEPPLVMRLLGIGATFPGSRLRQRRTASLETCRVGSGRRFGNRLVGRSSAASARARRD